MPNLSPLLALLTLGTALFGTGNTFAANPIVPGVGLTDPYGVAYGNKLFIYATHDFSAQSRRYVMKDWWVWSSSDLVNWKQAGTMKPEDTFIGKPFDSCWGTSSLGKNGKCYWYFSAGPLQVGVDVADAPAGPWKDPLGKPLLPQGLTPTQERDPTVFIDDDGKAYLVFGTFDYFIVHLNDDMISLAEKPHPVEFDRRFGPYGEGKTDDKPSLHKRNGIYYFSWCSFYATSNNVYGPYIYKGSVIDPALIAPKFHSTHPLMDRHGNFFRFNNQWYYACNDYSQPGRSAHFRDAVISYVHYRDDGTIAPVRIDAVGVGEYDGASSRIEAEDYFKSVNAGQGECPAGGFEMRDLTTSSELYYPQVMNLRVGTTMAFSAASAGAGGDLEVHAGSPSGARLGTCHITSTGGWDKFQTFVTQLTNAPGTMDLCLTFKGGAGDLMHIDWFGFPTP